MSCISDDAQGEPLEVLWDAEIAPEVLDDDGWSSIGRSAPDSAEVLAAHIRAVRWNSATAAERDLLQAPFRAGIRLDCYQLLPLRKALRLPRVNLLIADDVGLGKTIEAGLVVRELLLRRRIDFVVVAAPPAMTAQWKDELETKFGLDFVVIDRDSRRRDQAHARVHLPPSYGGPVRRAWMRCCRCSTYGASRRATSRRRWRHCWARRRRTCRRR